MPLDAFNFILEAKFRSCLYTLSDLIDRGVHQRCSSLVLIRNFILGKVFSVAPKLSVIRKMRKLYPFSYFKYFVSQQHPNGCTVQLACR